MKLLIKNGRLIDPATSTDKVEDILLDNGYIVSWGKADEEQEGLQIVDASGYMVMPGLIDMHVHLRDPGQTWKEDVYSGAAAAAKGGFTTIVAMANTVPVTDSADKIAAIMKRANETSIHIIQTGSVTLEMEGVHLADIQEMAAAGYRVISEDGKSVMNSGLFRRALAMAARYGVTVLDHCEDKYLVNGGCVNEDRVSRKEGLPGITNSVEDSITARDLMIAGDTGAHLHLCHMSTADSVELLREAKKRGYNVSGEATPHHLILTSEDRKPLDTNYKMNPPLRTEKDRQAIVNGLLDGTIDVISTDHAPHRGMEKDTTMVKAPFGIVGLETAAPLIWTEFVRTGKMTPLQMAEKMSWNPAKLLGLERRGSIYPGSEADLIIWDPDAFYRINAESFLSK
ncbi:MAG: dihydroorotase, partial [Lachnospiraceae bacterium]|nr:dihydroorotase [Lachnospiraceae bacterium]